jgi:SAM-dependent methyltransferase
MELQKIYSTRFIEKELPSKNKIWKEICNYLSRYISLDDTVVDVGAGYCEFINNIKCKKKIAIDLNEDVKKFAHNDVNIIHESCMSIKSIESSSVNIVFMSNFLEHLSSKAEVYETIKESKRILKKGGLLIILQPNIRFLADVYWDFFDHNIPLSDRSLAEVIQTLDMDLFKLHPKFLPYTTKSKLPQWSFLVKIYLRIPVIWKILGKQALIIARKGENV